MSVGMTILQSINILLALALLAAVIAGVFLLVRVLFKLNKALDIWLKQNENNQE